MVEEQVLFENQFIDNQRKKLNRSLKEREIERIKSDNRFLLWIALIIAFMLMVVVLNTYVYVNVQVKGPSMQPTLYTDDVLVANRYKKPERGDIIIIKNEKPNSNDWLIKRVIAMEGDTVQIENGMVKINGKYIDEPYAKGPTTDKDCQWVNETKLNKGEIFYLGDNRGNSSDSRSIGFGTCNENQIVGVVTDWSLYLLRTFRK